MKILVTGAEGFIGRELVEVLKQNGINVVAATRGLKHGFFATGDISSTTDWRSGLKGCDVVVHLAARVHQGNERAADPLLAFRQVNVDGTLNLARQAAEAGVRRFLFLSSIKVNGEATRIGHPFTVDDVPSPQDAYSISKWEAEQNLRKMAFDTALEMVFIRSPLVYGVGAKGNFASMVNCLARGIPLPLGAVIHNRRSLVSLGNLIDLIVTCLDHPAASNRTFLISDGEDLSTADLLRRLAIAMGKPARLFSVPPSWLQVVASLVGKPDIARRLLGNLQVEISYTCRTLRWTPPISVDQGFSQAVRDMNL